MRKLFPTMSSRPDTEKVVGTFAYWFLSVVIIPLFLPFVLQDFYSDPTALAWFEVVYHVLNCAVMVAVHWNYLYFAWMDLQLKWKECLAVIGICVVLILALVFLPMLVIDPFVPVYAVRTVPVVELELLMFPSQALESLPLVAALSITLAAPVATCCMIYAVCFAPGCCSKKPWVGYLALALLVALPRVLCTSFVIDAANLWSLYFAQLPIHLICCWAFQKTDTVLVPVGILTGVNLVSCLVL